MYFGNLWPSVVVELLASLIEWLLLGSIAAVIGIVFVFSKRGQLVKFFNISTDHPVVRIYMSLVYVKEGGALYVDGSEASIYQGGTVVAGEFLELQTLTEIFRTPTIFNFIPPVILSILGRWKINLTKIEVITQPCPLDVNELKGNVIILVGGPEFNAGTRYYLDRGGTFLRFLPKKAGIEIISGHSAGQRIYPQGDGMNLAIIEKQTYIDEKRTVFILAGTGVNGTRAAMRYLSKNWRKLYKMYKNGNFGICIQCENRRKNPLGYIYWDVLRRIPYIE